MYKEYKFNLHQVVKIKLHNKVQQNNKAKKIKQKSKQKKGFFPVQAKIAKKTRKNQELNNKKP